MRVNFLNDAVPLLTYFLAFFRLNIVTFSQKNMLAEPIEYWRPLLGSVPLNNLHLSEQAIALYRENEKLTLNILI